MKHWHPTLCALVAASLPLVTSAQTNWPGGIPWIQPSHSGIRHVGITADASYLVTTGDETVKVWQKDGTFLRTYNFYAGQFVTEAFAAANADGQRVVFLDQLGQGQVWGPDPLAPSVTFQLPDPPKGLALSPDGNQMVILEATSTEVRTVPGNALRATIPISIGVSRSMAYAPEADWVVTGTSMGHVFVNRASDGFRLDYDQLGSPVVSLDVLPDGSQIVVLTEDGVLRLLHPTNPLLDSSKLALTPLTGRQVRYLGLSGGVGVLTLEDRVRFFSVPQLNPVGNVLSPPPGTVFTSLEGSPTENTFALGTTSGRTFRYAVGNTSPLTPYGTNGGDVWRLTRDLGNDDLYVIRGFAVQKFSGSTGQIVWELADPNQDYLAIGSLSGGRLVTGVNNGIRILNASTGAKTSEVVHNEYVDTLAVRADGQRYAYAFGDGTLQVRNSSTHALVTQETPAFFRTVLALAWVGEELLVVSAESDQTRLYRWNLTTNVQVPLLTSSTLSWPDGMAVRHDGKRAVVFGGLTGEDIVFDPWNPETPSVPLITDEAIEDADWLQDGRVVAVGQSVMVFDEEGNSSLLVQDGGAYARQVASLRNPRQLAVGRLDGTVMVGGLARSLYVTSPEFVGDYSRFNYRVWVRKVSDGALVADRTGTLSPRGELQLPVDLDEPAEVTVKAGTFLSRKQTFDFRKGPAGRTLIVVAGDIDRDDQVTVFDYDQLSAVFDQDSSQSGWTTANGAGIAPMDSDLDGDGAVTVFDYDILSRYFDRQGEA